MQQLNRRNYNEKKIRKLNYLAISLVLQYPVWVVIWLLGRLKLIKTLFLLYPTTIEECRHFYPDYKILHRLVSGRVCPVGFIMEGWRPIGIYCVIPNTVRELALKKNKRIVDKITRRILFFKKISGAETIGLAGQLALAFKKHGIAVKPPFFASTFGNLFSIKSSLDFLVNKVDHSTPINKKVSIIGGGDLTEMVRDHLENGGYTVSTVAVKQSRKGVVSLVDEASASQQLKRTDYAINLLLTGKDFLGCDLQQLINKKATIIDYSRPCIPRTEISHHIVFGNRVQRDGIRFLLNLPGGWKNNEIPACSMPGILAAKSPVPFTNMREFQQAANNLGFRTALDTDTVVTSTTPGRLRLALSQLSVLLTASLKI